MQSIVGNPYTSANAALPPAGTWASIVCVEGAVYPTSIDGRTAAWRVRMEDSAEAADLTEDLGEAMESCIKVVVR